MTEEFITEAFAKAGVAITSVKRIFQRSTGWLVVGDIVALAFRLFCFDFLPGGELPSPFWTPNVQGFARACPGLLGPLTSPATTPFPSPLTPLVQPSRLASRLLLCAAARQRYGCGRHGRPQWQGCSGCPPGLSGWWGAGAGWGAIAPSSPRTIPPRTIPPLLSAAHQVPFELGPVLPRPAEVSRCRVAGHLLSLPPFRQNQPTNPLFFFETVRTSPSLWATSPRTSPTVTSWYVLLCPETLLSRWMAQLTPASPFRASSRSAIHPAARPRVSGVLMISPALRIVICPLRLITCCHPRNLPF